MQLKLVILAVLARLSMGQYCGVGTSPVKSYQKCEVDQYPEMDAACKAIGGTVSGHLQEVGDQRSNCVTYCNHVPTAGHDIRGTTKYHEQWRLYVVDTCEDCDYCGHMDD